MAYRVFWVYIIYCSVATKNTGFVSGSDAFYLYSEYVFAT